MPVTLFTTLAIKKALDDVILDAFTVETGIMVECVADPTVRLLERIAAGERFDVMVGVSESFASLGEFVSPESVVPIARTGVGLATLRGAPVPDVSTVDTFVATLLRARSVAYSRTGASGIYFADLIERLGIASELNSRATVVEKGFVADAVVDGRADLAVQQLSELLFVTAVQIVGPFPTELQHYTEFSAALNERAVADFEAIALLDFLSGVTARAAYAATQLEA
jgi:molybdate transport system substrate-binding protein